MLTSLEPTLGVMSACLPMLQPVASKLANTQLLNYINGGGSSKTGSSRRFFNNSSRNRSGRSEETTPKNFIRITGDTYSLTDRYATQNEINGYAAHSDVESGTTAETTRKDGRVDDRIRIKRGWDVQSQ